LSESPADEIKNKNQIENPHNFIFALLSLLRERSSKMDDRKPAAATKRKKSTTKKRKASSSSSTGRTADLSAVLPWIPRAQLEALITSSVNDHSAITTEQVINAMPDHEKWRIDPSDGKKKKSYTPVKSGPERVNTGAFDAVDSTTMLNIFMFLNCKEKYNCVMSVCKGWREFKATMPSLFLDLR